MAPFMARQGYRRLELLSAGFTDEYRVSQFDVPPKIDQS